MKAFVIRLNLEKITVIMAAAALFSFAALFVCRTGTASEPRLIPIYSVETDKPEIALTFDCAWGDSDLDEISGILKENGVSATFFVTGEFAENYPEKLLDLKNSGHEIANHSNSHPHITRISVNEFIKDTLACNEAIKKAIGEYPKLYRAPYGEYNNKVISALNKLNLPMIQWDCDSRDWQEGANVDSIKKYINKNIQNGSILLFHVDAKPKMTAKALKTIIPELKSNGYKFKIVSDLIYSPPYKLDAKGRMSKSD